MNKKLTPLPYADYASFLLRLWQKRNDQEDIWIASLQSTATGEDLAFSSMEAFIRFLQNHFMAGQTPEQEGQDPARGTEQDSSQGDEK